MSGLEPLAALGLACNILQLIEVGGTTIKLAKNIYQSSSPAIDQTLQDNAAVLNTISSEVKAVNRPASLSKLDQQLVTTADKCSTAARDLEEEVQFLLRNAKQKQLAATLKIVAKTTWRKRRLDRLKESLESAEKLMTKTILAQIWSRTRAVELDLSKVNDDLRAFIQQYESGTKDKKQLISSEHLATRKHVSASAKETLEAIDGVRNTMNRLTLDADVQVDQTKRERLLRSLKFPAFNERKNQLSKAHESTFEWIFIGDDGPLQVDLEGSDLEDSDWDDSDLEDLDLADPSEASWDLFSNWLSSTSDVYWISGKPGSGKTTLVKFVLDHPRTIACLHTWSPKALMISHYFWRPGSAMQQNIKGLLCSLLCQLLDKDVAAVKNVLQDIQARSLDTKDTDTDWSIAELRSTFLQTLSSYKRPVCIFIDGLDEVHPNDGPVELLDLVLQFPRCQDVKLCLASRPEPILEERLSAYPHLRLQDLTRPDLVRYARDHLKFTGSTFCESQIDGLSAIEHPIRLLLNKAEGVFLWLILATRSINQGFTYGDTTETIWQRIDALPRDLTKLYQDMWNRVCADSPRAYRQTAALYFRLILLHPDIFSTLSRFHSSLLHLMLASTSFADQLLEAIDAPSTIVTEDKLLKACKAVERKLNLYCFGLIETTIPPSRDNGVIGWYGAQYNTLWSRYGRRRLHFIHRTARDFLLDTVDGAQILNHDSTSEISLSFTWARAHLAISQLFPGADSRLGRTSDILDYTTIFDKSPRGFNCSGDPDRSRTISYLEKLCNSGQLLSGYGEQKRLCGGVDFFKAAARIQDEYILPSRKLSTFSKATISEILLNVVEGVPGMGYDVSCKNSAEPLIMMLLSEGADPNWRGHTFLPGAPSSFTGFAYSDVRTPFTEYLNTMMWVSEWPRSKETIAILLKNLYGFLSHSANLNDTIYRAFRYAELTNDVYEGRWEPSVEMTLHHMGPYAGKYYGDLVVAFPTWIVVKALLAGLDSELEHSLGREDSECGETRSLLARSRKHLDNWSNRGNGHVIGRLTFEEVEKQKKDNPMRGRAWYVPMEDYPVETTKKLIRGLEKRLLNTRTHGDRFTNRIVVQLVQELSWTGRTTSHPEILESLTRLGIIAPRGYETHNIQYWVDRFQEKLVIERKLVDETKSPQHPCAAPGR